MYREITNGIQIEVEPEFIPEQSKPEQGYYFFNYRVRIQNLSDNQRQLINRFWVITDGSGKKEKVYGPGVVGKQPSLAPGESFEYSSFCPLPTPTGNMRGEYEMLDLTTGEKFRARIPLFFLRDINTLH